MLDYNPLIIAEMEIVRKGEQDSLDKVRAISGSRAKSYEGAGGDSTAGFLFSNSLSLQFPLPLSGEG